MTARIVVTGSDGFIGKNLRLRLAEHGYADVVGVTRATTPSDLRAALERAAFVYHLAGVNRPSDTTAFDRDNRDFTETLCEILAEAERPAALAYASSTQAALDNPYGRSKRAAERIIEDYGQKRRVATYVLRLTNVFGKWSRPNYNSAIATFCYNLAHGLPVTVHDRNAPLSLVYIDDVVASMIALLGKAQVAPGFIDVGPIHQTTVGEVAEILGSFPCSRQNLGRAICRIWPDARVVRDLSQLSAGFRVRVSGAEARRSSRLFRRDAENGDERPDLVLHRGPRRHAGEHYHHSKTEKFLVAKGRARFGFRNIVTNETHEITVDGDVPQVVETVPGWAHDVTNVGDDEMVVMLWANEVFDPARPDTVASKVGQ